MITDKRVFWVVLGIVAILTAIIFRSCGEHWLFKSDSKTDALAAEIRKNYTLKMGLDKKVDSLNRRTDSFYRVIDKRLKERPAKEIRIIQKYDEKKIVINANADSAIKFLHERIRQYEVGGYH